MTKIWITAGVACVLTLAGCGGGSEQPAPKADAGAAAGGGAAATPDLANGATVSGKVTFDGTPPVMKVLDMSAVPACTEAHKTPAKSEELIVGSDKGVKNAFVWIKSGLPADKTWAVPTGSVEITQDGCMYSPHVLGVMAGQNLSIKNADKTNHNIHPMPKINPEFNQSQPPGAGDIAHMFAREEVLVPVKCNIHPWMRAYIGVVSHPFFAVTGDDGSYSIKGLPPGTYTIEVVHEHWADQPQDQTITVGAKDSKTQDFTLKG
jgi:plastocyanin